MGLLEPRRRRPCPSCKRGAQLSGLDHADRLQRDSGAVEQAPQNGTPLGRLEVKADALLAEIAHHRKRSVTARLRRADAHPIPAVENLDLDDGGAILSQ